MINLKGKQYCKTYLLLVVLWCGFFRPSLGQEQSVIRGTVANEQGELLPGISVLVSGKEGGTVTDEQGAFSISAQRGEVLVFSSVGYQPKRVEITETVMRVTLQPAQADLEEVVVVGYGQQRKGDITGAVATMNTERLAERPVVRVDQALVGQMAGVRVRQTTGNPGQGMSVQVRGVGSISAGNEPLYVVDGFPLSGATPNANGGYSTGTPLDNINPNDIESIQVHSIMNMRRTRSSKAIGNTALRWQLTWKAPMENIRRIPSSIFRTGETMPSLRMRLYGVKTGNISSSPAIWAYSTMRWD